MALLEFETQEDIDILSKELHDLLDRLSVRDMPKTREFLNKLDEKKEG
jgi:hypothetical protein